MTAPWSGRQHVPRRRTLHLPALRSYQRALVDDPAQTVIVLAATQVGKTYALACWMLARLWCARGKQPWWWVAPSYLQTEPGRALIHEMARERRVLDLAYRQPPYSLILINGRRVEFRTWDDPDSLRGSTVAGMVIDEAGLLTEAAWSALSSRLVETQGPARLIGNPGPFSGAFRRLCSLAQSSANVLGMDGRPRYSFRRWTWRDRAAALEEPARSAYVEEVEEDRRSMMAAHFAEKYEAEWTEDEDSFFRGLPAPDGPPLDAPLADESYVIGVDVGQEQDYLVAIAIGTKRNRADHMERWRGVPYSECAARLEALAREWRASMLIEINGAGKPLYEALAERDVEVRGFTTTGQSKQDVLSELHAQLKRTDRPLRLAEMPPLQHELASYRYQRRDLGRYSYGAPEGEHDDCVMALALACWARRYAVETFAGYV